MSTVRPWAPCAVDAYARDRSVGGVVGAGSVWVMPVRVEVACRVPSSCDGVDPVDLAVDQAEVAVDAAGLDQVSDAGGGAVAVELDDVRADEPGVGEVAADGGGDLGGVLVAAGDDDGVLAGEPVGGGGAGDRGDGVAFAAGVDEPAVGVVVGDGVRLPVAQPQGGVGFPVVGEAADLGEGVGLGVAVDRGAHHAAGADGAELVRVAHQHDAGAGGVRRRPAAG